MVNSGEEGWNMLFTLEFHWTGEWSWWAYIVAFVIWPWLGLGTLTLYEALLKSNHSLDYGWPNLLMRLGEWCLTDRVASKQSGLRIHMDGAVMIVYFYLLCFVMLPLGIIWLVVIWFGQPIQLLVEWVIKMISEWRQRRTAATAR